MADSKTLFFAASFSLTRHCTKLLIFCRFSTRSREYRYFIPYDEGELDVEAMQTAAASFVGQHDFRHFCKVDAEHVHHFVRHILDFRIEQVPDCKVGRRTVLQVHLRGSAFLWHQVLLSTCNPAIFCCCSESLSSLS